MKYKTTRGFTLIELMVVISIIGLLSSVIFAALNSARSRGRDSTRISSLVQVRSALELYRSYYNTYPVANSGNPTTDLNTLKAALVPQFISQLSKVAGDADPVYVSSNGSSYTYTISNLENPLPASSQFYIFGQSTKAVVTPPGTVLSSGPTSSVSVNPSSVNSVGAILIQWTGGTGATSCILSTDAGSAHPTLASSITGQNPAASSGTLTYGVTNSDLNNAGTVNIGAKCFDSSGNGGNTSNTVLTIIGGSAS